MDTPSRAPNDVSDLEAAELAVVDAVAGGRRHPLMRLVGAVSEIADQPPLFALCGLTTAAGFIRGDRRLLGAGVAMLVAHSLATWVKGLVKDAVNRTRPHKALDEGRYEMRPGTSRDGNERSFPSGHTAGAVAVAVALAGSYPRAAVPAYGLAAAVAAVQVPRGKHYPTDLVAGLLIGVAAGMAGRGVLQLLRSAPVR